VAAQGQLPQVAETLGAARLVLGSRQGGHQKRRQDTDDGEDDEEFKEGESAVKDLLVKVWFFTGHKY